MAEVNEIGCCNGAHGVMIRCGAFRSSTAAPAGSSCIAAVLS